MAFDQDTDIRRAYADVRALAEPRRVCASRTREHFKRGGALGGEGFLARYLDLVIDRNKLHLHEQNGELQPALDCLKVVGLVEGRRLTDLGEAMLPILDHEGMSSQFVWYALWINLSCAWLGAMAWNMLTRQGPAMPLLAEPLCSYLCGDDIVDSLDRGAASSLEKSFQDTPWGQLGIGEAPAYGRRLWLRPRPRDVDPLLVLYGLYRSAGVSGMLTIDSEQLAALPHGPCVTLGIDGTTAEHQLLSLWLPGLLTQRREGDRVVYSVQTDKDACDVVREYVRRRGYQ